MGGKDWGPGAEWRANWRNRAQVTGGPSIMPDATAANQSRAQQDSVIQTLHRLALGDPNSEAQQSLRNSFDQARAGQASAASLQRHGNAGTMANAVSNNQQDLTAQQTGASNVLQSQEQQSASQALLQLLAQQRGQDQNLADMSAQGSLKNQQLDQQTRDFYSRLGMGSDLSVMTNKNAAVTAGLGFDQQSRDMSQQFWQQIMQGAGTAAGAAGKIWGGSGTPPAGGQ